MIKTFLQCILNWTTQLTPKKSSTFEFKKKYHVNIFIHETNLIFCRGRFGPSVGDSSWEWHAGRSLRHHDTHLRWNIMQGYPNSGRTRQNRYNTLARWHELGDIWYSRALRQISVPWEGAFELAWYHLLLSYPMVWWLNLATSILITKHTYSR